MKPHYKKLYEDEYFKDRHADALREEMYLQEINRLQKFIPNHGRILDVGCGMGNFLDLFDSQRWQKYGTEVSHYAIIRAQKKGIKFNFENKKNYFDVVIYRGTLQHLNNPLFEIENRIKQLKKGGYLIFLATPNIGGWYYRLFQDLPMLDPKRNFALFSDKTLSQVLVNFGLKIKLVTYPYLNTPYAHPISDHIYFMLRILRLKYKRHAFWKNMMEIYAQKPN